MAEGGDFLSDLLGENDMDYQSRDLTSDLTFGFDENFQISKEILEEIVENVVRIGKPPAFPSRDIR